ncbi:MAG: hypothetical protein V2A69_15375 [Pseudomonadota bacterium]
MVKIDSWANVQPWRFIVVQDKAKLGSKKFALSSMSLKRFFPRPTLFSAILIKIPDPDHERP